jgi:hypothetical protein
MIKKYTYWDWYDGKVVLQYCRFVFDKEKQEAPIVVSWENFDEGERMKISQMQEQMFEEAKTSLLLMIQDDLNNSLKHTSSKQLLIKRLLKKYDDIINGNLNCNGTRCYSSDLVDMFQQNYYTEMLQFINLCGIGGRQYDFSNLNSPNCKYQVDFDDQFAPEVRGAVLIEVREFLLNERIKLREVKSRPPIQDVQLTKAENPYPHIFKSVQAFDLFCCLEKEIILIEHYPAECSFVFHALKNPKLGYLIRKTVTANKFCEFLMTDRSLPEIDYTLIKNRVTKHRMAILDRILKIHLTGKED